MTVIATGRQKRADLLIGSNTDEATFPYVGARRMGLGFDAIAEYQAHIRERWGPDSEDFLRLYPAGTAEEMKASQLRAFNDEVAWNERRIAESPGAGARFLYLFGHTPPGSPPGRGATHTAEIRYVFANPTPGWSAADRHLASQMSSYWVNFVSNGDPNDSGLPAWPRISPDDVPAMPLGSEGPAAADMARSELFNRLFERTFVTR